MHFEITHEFDAPLDALELALLSPDLGAMMVPHLASTAVASVETIEHVIQNGELRRVLRFQASAPLAMFRGYDVAREALSWEESSIYRLSDHAASWSVSPREQFRKYFSASGTCRLEAAPDGRARRIVEGDIDIKASLLSSLAGRMALVEIRKIYDAEAETLRRLSTL
ncbi:DUF2505 domain-containing protein [Polyangium spumosum]|uniref:DUF2505 domain-containing protein n=1 Tax=Polyangium spumosum TaxID=889282 RepID=A0A6N7PR71_9BACT|nr:DUF2505 domain-containing protein [Polyangium spumosum]MRG94682.1 DUF2505 domain-containing protein [Polyangium spumosum]